MLVEIKVQIVEKQQRTDIINLIYKNWGTQLIFCHERIEMREQEQLKSTQQGEKTAKAT